MAQAHKHEDDKPVSHAKAPFEPPAGVIPQPAAAEWSPTVANPDPPAKTIADEQRERSAYYEEHGIGSYAELTPESVASKKVVPGVTELEHHEEPHRGRR